MRNRFREFFKSAYTQLVIAALIGVACATMALHRYPATYIIFAIAGVCLLVRVPLSDSVHAKYLQVQRRRKKLQQKPKNSRRKEAVERATRAHTVALALHCTFVLLAVAASLGWTRWEEIDWDLSQPIGRLEPAQDVVEPICRNIDTQPPHSILPPDVTAVYLGPNRYFADGFPYAAVSNKNGPILSLNRDDEGRISITIDIRGKDGKIIARFEKGVFTVNQNNVLRVSRPDASTLVVDDQYGERVLNVRYRNRRVLEITGVLYLKDVSEPMRITQDEISLPTAKGTIGTIAGFCSDYDGLTHMGFVFGNSADFD